MDWPAKKECKLHLLMVQVVVIQMEQVYITPQKIMMQLFLNLVHQLSTVLTEMVGLQMYQVQATDNVFWKVEHPSGASGLNYTSKFALSNQSGENPSTANVGTANAGATWSELHTTFGHNSMTGRRGIDIYHTSDYTSNFTVYIYLYCNSISCQDIQHIHGYAL